MCLCVNLLPYTVVVYDILCTEIIVHPLILYLFILGIKFVVLSDPRQVGQDSFLKKLYEIYADYALKNPFYSIDMPIK